MLADQIVTGDVEETHQTRVVNCRLVPYFDPSGSRPPRCIDRLILGVACVPWWGKFMITAAGRSRIASRADSLDRLRRRRRTIALLAIAALLLSGMTARLFVWPELPSLPSRADAIVELGGPGNRDGAALALAREHEAPILVQSTVVAEAGTDTCLPPVKDVTILCFNADPPTTRGEARYIATLAAERGWRSVILVTSRDHAWRARLRVERCFHGDVYVSMTPLPVWAWPRQIAYQWAATAKAVLLEREC
jgi:uncharacterized SAM-binding protein YcdF (DUF218 family)